MRIPGSGLNPDDPGRSKWIGGHGGGDEKLYATYGGPIVSIFGRQGRDIDALLLRASRHTVNDRPCYTPHAPREF